MSGGESKMAEKRAKIAVVGSLNADLTAYVETLPQPGQTISAHHYHVFPGGKGANQAVAAAKLGAHVSMYGCVGFDSYCQLLLTSLQNVGISVANVRKQKDLPTGIALILVENSSENEIVVIAGANAAFTPDILDQMDLHEMKQADALLLQHEIPMETIEKSAKLAHDAGVTVILNPAPARHLSLDLLQHVDVLIPNQSELQNILSSGYTMEQLFATGVKVILETRGANGVIVHSKEYSQHVDAVKVDAVDTVGAGDTFVAAFSVAYCSGVGLIEAVHYATHAAAYSTERKGAQSSFPNKEELASKGVRLP
jgi:ribokinase